VEVGNKMGIEMLDYFVDGVGVAMLGYYSLREKVIGRGVIHVNRFTMLNACFEVV